MSCLDCGEILLRGISGKGSFCQILAMTLVCLGLIFSFPASVRAWSLQADPNIPVGYVKIYFDNNKPDDINEVIVEVNPAHQEITRAGSSIVIGNLQIPLITWVQIMASQFMQSPGVIFGPITVPRLAAPMPVVGGPRPMVGGPMPMVGGPMPMVGGPMPMVGGPMPMVGDPMPMVGGPGAVAITPQQVAQAFAQNTLLQQQVLQLGQQIAINQNGGVSTETHLKAMDDQEFVFRKELGIREKYIREQNKQLQQLRTQLGKNQSAFNSGHYLSGKAKL